MNTVITLITKGRLSLLQETMQALRDSNLSDTELYVVDNGSEDGTIDFLKGEQKKWKKSFHLILNPSNVPQWQKSYAIRQVQRKSLIEYPDWAYFGWMDDDIVVQPDWLESGRKVLDRFPEVAVASMHQDDHQEMRHPTVKIEPIGNLKVRFKRTANGACWLMRRGFFNQYGLPPVDGWSVTNCAKDDDTYNKRLRGSTWFGVIDKVRHTGYNQSRRRAEMRRKR